MTDALKSAIREALVESGYSSPFAAINTDALTSALTRRSVMVQAEGQREAQIDLVTHKRAWLDAFKMARSAMIRNAECDGSYMDHESAVLERVVNALRISPVVSDRTSVEAAACKALHNATRTLIRDIDARLHDIINDPSISDVVKQLADGAHGSLHSLAGLASEDPDVREVAGLECGVHAPGVSGESVALTDVPVRRVCAQCGTWRSTICGEGCSFGVRQIRGQAGFEIDPGAFPSRVTMGDA